MPVSGGELTREHCTIKTGVDASTDVHVFVSFPAYNYL